MGALFLTACSLFGAKPIPCDTDDACPLELACVNGHCRSPVNLPPRDAGPEPFFDAGPKIISDAGPSDAGPARDTGQDAGPDPVDAGPLDAGLLQDAGIDAGPPDIGVWHEPAATRRRAVTLRSVSGDIPAETLLRLRTPSALTVGIRFYLASGVAIPLTQAEVGNQDEDDTVLSIFRVPIDVALGESIEGFVYHAPDSTLSNALDPSLPNRRVVPLVSNDLNTLSTTLPGNDQTRFVAVGSSSLESLSTWSAEIGNDDVRASAPIATRVDSAFAGAGRGGEQLECERVANGVEDVVVVGLAVRAESVDRELTQGIFPGFGETTVAPPDEAALGIFQVRTENNQSLLDAQDNAIRLTLNIDGTVHGFDAYGLNNNVRESGLVVQAVDAQSSVTLSGSRSALPGAGIDGVRVKARYILSKDIDVHTTSMVLVNRQAQAEIPSFGSPPREGVVLVTGRATFTHDEIANTLVSVSISANGDVRDSQANLAIRTENIEDDRTLRTVGRAADYRGDGAIDITVDVQNQGTTAIEDLIARAVLLHEVSTTVDDNDQERPQ